MKIGYFKVGDGTRIGSSVPTAVQNVKAVLAGNQITLTWDAIAGSNVYYQVIYSNDSNFNNTTQVWTGISGNPANIVDGFYYTSNTFNNATPSLQAGTKYVLLKSTTNLTAQIPLRSVDAINAVSGIPASDVSRNFYFRVRASYGIPNDPLASNQTLAGYQLAYPDGYGNWGIFSPLTSSSTLNDVIWTNTTSLDGRLRVALDSDFINDSDPKYGSIGVVSGLEYTYTKDDVVGAVIVSAVSVESLKIISTDVTGIIRNFNSSDPTNYTVEPLSTVPYYVANSQGQFILPYLKLTSTNGTKTVTYRTYASQDASGSPTDFTATILYDNVAPTVTSIPIAINGTPGNLISSSTSTIVLDLTNVTDAGSLPYLVYIEGLNGSVSSKYYLYKTSLDITNDLNLQNNASIQLRVQIYDKADNVTNKISVGDNTGIITVKLSVNDPIASVYNLQALSLYTNETDVTARNTALKFTNNRNVKIYVDNNGEPVSFWRYSVVKSATATPDDSAFSSWLAYSSSMKFNTASSNNGYAVDLGSADQTFYRVWVQTKLTSAAVSNKVFYDIWIDSTAPTIQSFSFAAGVTNNADVIVNNIVCNPNDPSGSPSNNNCYKMKIFGSGVSAVSKTINDLPVSQNVNQWIPFNSSIRFKLDSSVEGAKTVSFAVEDFALNVVSNATTITITLQLSGPTYSYAFTYSDGGVDGVNEVPRLVNKVKGYHGTEDQNAVKNVKVKFTFSDAVKAATVRRISVQNQSSGASEQVYTNFDPNSLYTGGFLIPDFLVLTQTSDSGKNNIVLRVTDNANNTNTQNTFIVLDADSPQSRVISFLGAVNGSTVTNRNVSIVVSCQDRTTTGIKITGDITNPDTDYSSQLMPLVSFNPGDNPTLDGLLHPLSLTVSKNLIAGDGQKNIKVEFQDYALNHAIGSSVSPGVNSVITLDTSGGEAPLNLIAQGYFPNNQYNNYYIVLNWNAPMQQNYSIAYYNIYEIQNPPYDFDSIYGNPSNVTYTTKGTVNPTATTWTIQNVPQDQISVPRHYRVTAVVTNTFNESSYSNEVPALFISSFKLTLNFQDIVPEPGSNAVATLPVAAISLPRTLSKDQININITPNDLVSYIGKQYNRQGWGDLITTIYAWNNALFNSVTQTTGSWVIINQTSPLASTYIIKESEGLVLEFISSAVGTVTNILFDGLPWSYGTISIPIKQGLNFIGMPRTSYTDPPALASAVNSVVEVSGLNETLRTWESFVSAIPAYKPDTLNTFAGGVGYFVRANQDTTIDFAGDIWPGNVTV